MVKTFVAFFVLSTVAIVGSAMSSPSHSSQSIMPSSPNSSPDMADMESMPDMSPMPMMPAMSPSPSMDDQPDVMVGKEASTGMSGDKPDMMEDMMMSMPDMDAMSSPSASPFIKCSGEATYTLNFINLLTPFRFGSKIPANGLVYSPAIGVSHSNRISLLTVRGFASPQVEEIAETGNNEPLASLSRSLMAKDLVLNVSTATGPTMPGYTTTLKVTVDCMRPFVTMLSMIAPSPDWIVQVSNRNMFDEKLGRFIGGSAGPLIAYDAGTDSGREFTDPADASLDMPTEPAQNIAPLREDETDRFGGRVVGWYKFIRVV